MNSTPESIYRPDSAKAFTRNTSPPQENNQSAPNSDRLHYTVNLEQEANRFTENESELWGQLDLATDPLQQEFIARQLAIGYLVLTGNRLDKFGQNNPSMAAAARTSTEISHANHRFKDASFELFGQPEPSIAAGIAYDRLVYYQSIRDQIDSFPALEELTRLDHVIDTLQQLVANQATERDSLAAINETSKDVAKKLKPVFDEFLAPIFEPLDNQPKQDKFSPSDIIRLLNHAKPTMNKLYPPLQDWGIKLETTQQRRTRAFESNGRTKTISIGHDNAKITYEQVKAKIAHEVFHAWRSMYGEQLNDQLSQFGYPSFLASEEGMATIAQLAYDGEIPPIRSERYLDYALALGLLGNKPFSRTEIEAFYQARTYVNDAISGKSPTDKELKLKAKKYGHRMFKGTRGEDYADDQSGGDISPAVNTQDIAYSLGFYNVTMALKKRLEAGEEPRALVLSIISGGKFDFTNPAHQERAAHLLKQRYS